MKALYDHVGLVAILLLPTHLSFSQTADSTRTPLDIGGGVTITNNGVSLIPTFILGKPAVLFDLMVRGKRHSFEPLQGKFRPTTNSQNTLTWEYITSPPTVLIRVYQLVRTSCRFGVPYQTLLSPTGFCFRSLPNCTT